LADYPVNVGELFKRAFTRDVLTRGRPSAHEWVSTLGSLSAATKQCKTNSNHHYFNGLKDCPWCRVEGAIGSAIFGIKLTVVRDEAFNLVGVWAQIESISPVDEALVPPGIKSLQSQYTPDPVIPKIVKQRRSFRLGSLGIVLAMSTCLQGQH
jgi:DNA-binding helix-hairpin-helix protein with protein kinase domain